MKKGKVDNISDCEAVEQTFLSWLQTSLTLIAFGFGIGSVIAVMEAHHYQKMIIKVVRVIGELLILVGLIAVVFAIMEHCRKLKFFKNQKNPCQHESKLPLFMSFVIILIGLGAFFSILIHMIWG